MVLHGDKAAQAKRVRDMQHLLKLPGIHRRRTDVKNFASTNEMIERFKRLLDGSGIVETVNLIEIDVVRAETSQAVINGVKDVFAGEPALVRIITHGVVDLRGDDHLVTGGAEFFECPPCNFFTDTEGVNISGVKEVDACLQRLAEERFAFVFL